MRLKHATVDERNAAVRVVHDDIAGMIDLWMGSGMASMFRNQAKQKLESPEGKQVLLKIVDDALDAAEKVRNAVPPPPPPPQDPPPIQTRA